MLTSACSSSHLVRLRNLTTEAVERSTKRLAPLYNSKAPVARLPAELLTKIFVYLEPVYRIDLTHVCALWRAIALDSPALLWSELPPVSNANLGRMLLERAGASIVDIPELRIFQGKEPVLEVVLSHMCRIRTLHIVVCNPALVISKERDLAAIMYTAAPALERFSISHPEASPPAALPLDKRTLFAGFAPRLRALAFNNVVAPLKFYRALSHPSSVHSLTMGGAKILIAMNVISDRSQLLPGLQTLNVEILRMKESTGPVNFPPSLRRLNFHYTGTNALEGLAELLVTPEVAVLETIHVLQARTGWRRSVTETAIPGSGSPYTELAIPGSLERNCIDASLIDQAGRRRYFVGIDPRHASEILSNNAAWSLTNLVIGTSALVLQIFADVRFPVLQTLQWILLADSTAFVQLVSGHGQLLAHTPALARIEIATAASNEWSTDQVAQLLKLHDSSVQTVREVVSYGFDPDVKALNREVPWVGDRVRVESEWSAPDSSWYTQAPLTWK